MKQKFIRDRTGDGYIDVAITLIIIVLLTASLLGLFPIFTAQQSLNQTAKYTARTVELCGRADRATLDSVTESGDFVEPDEIQVDAEWFKASDKTIQLKTPFTVTLVKTVPIVILRPSWGNPFVIHVRITASAHGISEVYHK